MKHILGLFLLLCSCSKVEEELNLTPDEGKEVEKAIETVVDKLIEKETGVDLEKVF